MTKVRGKVSAKDNVTISVSELSRCFSLLLLMVANDLILREPGIVLTSLGMGDSNLEFVRIWLNIAFFGALLIAGLLSAIFEKEASLRVLCALQGVAGLLSILMVAAYAISLFMRAPGQGSLPYALFFFLGLFAAFGLLIWVVNLSELPCELAWIELIGCLFVSAFSYVFFLYLASAFPAWVVFGVLYCVSFAANAKAVFSKKDKWRDSTETSDEASTLRDPKRFESASTEVTFRSLLIRAAKENYGSILCIASLNYVLTASRMVLESASANLVNSLCAGGICLAAIVLFVMDFVMKRDAEAPVVYGIAFPVIALAFLLMPFLDDAIRGVFMLVSTMFGTMGTTMLFLMAFRMKRTTGIPATCMYGLSSGFVHVFLFLGLVSGLGSVSPEGSDFARYTVFAAVLVYAFLIVFLVSRRRANARKDGSGIVFIGTEQDFSLACDAIADRYGLSQRECEVMRLLMLGLSVDDVASDLGIAASTVRTHNKNIYKKLEVHTRTELLRLVSK